MPASLSNVKSLSSQSDPSIVQTRSLESHLSSTSSLQRLRTSQQSHAQASSSSQDRETDITQDGKKPQSHAFTVQKMKAGRLRDIAEELNWPIASLNWYCTMESWLRYLLHYVGLSITTAYDEDVELGTVPNLRNARSCWLRYLLQLYCVFSIFYMSGTIYRWLGGGSFDVGVDVDQETISYLDAMPVPQRLARLLDFHPPPLGFEPNVLLASPPASSITACLWSEYDARVYENLVSWAQAWQGPISLLLSTTATPHSSEHIEILHVLQRIKSSPNLHSRISIHVLQIKSISAHSPNSYLNIARLFASTEAIILFPSNLSSTPDVNLPFLISYFNTQIMNSEIAQSDCHSPRLLLSNNTSTVKKPAMSPLFLPRSYPAWCHEHTLAFSSRAFAWDECVFQITLENLGDLPTINVNASSSALQDEEILISSFARRLRHRLGLEYRREACQLASKQLQSAPVTSDQKTQVIADREKWLKQFCAEWKERRP